MALPSVPATVRAAVQAGFQSSLRMSTAHDAMNAGHAWRKSSWPQPGTSPNDDGVSSGAGVGTELGTGICAPAGGTGSGVGYTGGGILTGGAAGAGNGRGSGVLHAASTKATSPRETGKLRRVNDIRIIMWALMIEAGVAFFLLVFIVWWTMYSGRKPDHEQHALPPAEKKEPPQLPDN